MNNVCLVGRLTKDPELRTTSSGLATTTFTIAVDGRRNPETGESSADFIQIVAWRNQAENICKYCQKGTQVAVQGRITSRSYDAQDGTKRYVTEVVANNVTFLGSKGGTSSGTDYNMEDNQAEPANLEEDPFKDIGQEVVLSDDDLPF
jgi:single-strand DNA-binding protein